MAIDNKHSSPKRIYIRNIFETWLILPHGVFFPIYSSYGGLNPVGHSLILTKQNLTKHKHESTHVKIRNVNGLI